MTKPLILALSILFALAAMSAQTPAWQPSPGHTQVPLWPGKVPDAQPVAGPEDTATVNNSLVYCAALKKAGVPISMHLYAQGGHAFGLRPTKLPVTAWPDLVKAWLRTIRMIPE